MANDAIFDSPSSDPSPEGGPTAADLTRQLALGIQQAISPMQQELAAVKQELAAARQVQQQPVAQGAGDSDMVSRFIANPEQTLRGEINNTVGPVLQPVLDAVTEPIVDKERARITARYGAKYWNEVVEPRFKAHQAQLRQTNPGASANPQAIRYIISSVVGSEELADVTEQHRQQTAKEAAEAAKHRERPPSFIGAAGRMPFTGSEDEPLPAEDKEFIDNLVRHGYKWTEADYRASRSKPRDMEERYQQEMAAERQSAKGAR